jgi:ribosomal protein S10
MDAGSHNLAIQKDTLLRERLEQGTKVSIVLASPISTPQTKQIWVLRISLHTGGYKINQFIIRRLLLIP